MADQTIADLPLISAVTSDISFPTDNGIITYRATAAQIKDFVLANGNVLLAALDDDIFHGLTDVTPAADDYFPLIDTSDSNKTKKGLVSTFVKSVYTGSPAFPYSIGVSDELIKFTGASGTATIPTAVGVAGKRYKLQHGGTSLTQVYTLATTSSQTIGGVAGGSYALYTNGETLVIESDGANWIIISHFAETAWSATATPVYLSSAANPLTMPTVTTNTISWRRSGKNCWVRIIYKQTASGTANSGTYGYRCTMPSGMQNIDTTVTGTNTVASGQDVLNCGLVMSAGGGSSGGGSLGGSANAAVYDATTFRLVGSWGGVYNALGSSLTLASGTGVSWNCVAEFPISGWQP